MTHPPDEQSPTVCPSAIPEQELHGFLQQLSWLSRSANSRATYLRKTSHLRNQARNGGRRRQSDPMNDGPPEQSQVGCRELRSTKYISDGQCTSINPIKELVCAGECLPAPLLPNWIGAASAARYWSPREAQEWRCVMERSRTQRIWLQCQDGSSRTYKISVVTSCKCKRYSRQHNDSRHKDASLQSGKEKRKDRREG